MVVFAALVHNFDFRECHMGWQHKVGGLGAAFDG